ncbi:MAG: HU family DNA-binding protein [Hydrogenobacter sp.]|uniref:HU family DNA-binding protein n=1 Tax=Hydrogenobacter thermophilus TaxID=940 RepID=UPI0030F650EB
MRKSEIINKLSEDHNISLDVAKKLVEEVLSWIVQKTAEEGRVEIRGFGVFKLKRRNGRFTKNPKTGIEMYIEDRYLISFKPSKKLLKKLNEEI